MKPRMLALPLALLLLFALCAPAFAGETLTIVNMNPVLYGGERDDQKYTMDIRYAWAIEQMEQAHPGIEIVHREVSVKQMLAGMMIKEPGLDLISSFSLDWAACAKAGLLSDLSAHAPLMANLIGWPSLDSLFVRDEKLWALPTEVQIHMMQLAQPEVFEAAGLALPEAGWTWDDLFDMGEALAAYNAAQGTAYRLLAAEPYRPFWMEQYMANTLHAPNASPSFLTPEFRSLMERWKGLVDQGLIERSFASGYGLPSLFAVRRISYAGMWDSVFLPMPVYAPDIYTTTARAEYFVVYEHSGQKELAMEFLTNFMNPTYMLSEDRMPYYFMSGILLEGDAWLHERFAIYREEAIASRLAEGRPESASDLLIGPPSLENDALWRSAFETSLCHMLSNSGLDGAIKELFEAYMQGKMPLDACLEEMEQRLLIMLGE